MHHMCIYNQASTFECSSIKGAAMFTVALFCPGRSLKERDILRKCLQLHRLLPLMHWGSLITESFTYCPCSPLTLQTCCSIHTVCELIEQQPQLLRCHQSPPAAGGQRPKTAEFMFTWKCQILSHCSQTIAKQTNMDPIKYQQLRFFTREFENAQVLLP